MTEPKLLNIKLTIIREFQKKYPNSHVGGSLGLMLLGHNLRRSLNDSDIDMTCDGFNPDDILEYDDLTSDRSCVGDFDYAYRQFADGRSVKVEVAVRQNFDYLKVFYEGNQYNVTNPRRILKFKREYASRGSNQMKHICDLRNIDKSMEIMSQILTINKFFIYEQQR